MPSFLAEIGKQAAAMLIILLKARVNHQARRSSPTFFLIIHIDLRQRADRKPPTVAQKAGKGAARGGAIPEGCCGIRPTSVRHTAKSYERLGPGGQPPVCAERNSFCPARPHNACGLQGEQARIC